MKILCRGSKRAAEMAAIPQGQANGDITEDSLSDLGARFQALAASCDPGTLDALQEFFVKQGAETLHHMGADMTKIASGLRSLSDLSAHGAAHLDPNASRRVLDRMRNLGDATLRQIDGRIAATVSRERRKRLQDLRDDMRNWLAARDAQLEKAERAVDDLKAHASMLRERCLIESNRLAKAAEFARKSADTSGSDPRLGQCWHASPEAAGFSGSLRALLKDERPTDRPARH